MEKEMASHSSILAWKIPWTEEPGRLQSMGSRRVRHDWATSLSLFTFMHRRRKWQPPPVFLPGESQGWEPSGLPSTGSHRVGHDWRDLAAAAAAAAAAAPFTEMTHFHNALQCINQVSINTCTQVCSWTFFFITIVYPCINLSILISEALITSLDIYNITFPLFCSSTLS